MKRHISDENQLKLLRMLDDFARSEGLALNEEITVRKFIDRISETVKKHGDNPALIHGFRIESMFAHIAAAMGESKILTEEDAGAFFSLHEKIRRPDFRLINRAGEQYFIEVKNFHQKDPLTPYKMKKGYLDSLLKLKFHRFLRKFKDHTNYLSKKSPIGMKIEFQFLCHYSLLFH